MAQRRMLSRKITETDVFIDMPLSTQALYFHLNMGADDEGFIDKAKTIQRTIGASDDDMKILISKGFLIPFESGVVVIRHWRIHNYIQSDRFQKTIYQKEREQLEYDNAKMAQLKPLESAQPKGSGQCIQDVSKTDTQYRLGKYSLGKNNNIYSLVSDNSNNCQETRQNIPYYKIIEYLNDKLQTRYKASSKKTQSLIKARYKEGFTYEDFIKVIDIKFTEWHNNDMKKYLRPETLFGTKFESYLNQPLEAQYSNLSKTPSSTPEWANPEYKEKSTPEEKAKLEKEKRELLEMLNRKR